MPTASTEPNGLSNRNDPPWHRTGAPEKDEWKLPFDASKGCTRLRFLLKCPSKNQWLADQSKVGNDEEHFTSDPYMSLNFVDYYAAEKRAKDVEHLFPDVTLEARRL